MKPDSVPAGIASTHKAGFLFPAGFAAAVIALISGSVASVSAATLTWNNGASTGNWNTTDANWTGSTWSSGTPDDATFSNINQTVTLTEAITSGTLSFQAGGGASGTHLLTLTGSSLSLSSITVNGVGLGGGVNNLADSTNQRLKLNNISVTASGNVSVGRGSMEVSGTTTLNIAGQLLATASTGDWSNFVMGAGASVTATGGVNFYNGLAATNLDLNGGTLTTAYIYGNKYANISSPTISVR